MHVTLLPYFYGKVMSATAVSFLLQSKTGQALQLPADPVFGLHNLLSPLTQLYKNLQQNTATTVTLLVCTMFCSFIRDRVHANIYP